jgi:hypothetical protein
MRWKVATTIFEVAQRLETNLYTDDVLQHYFLRSKAVISNIAAGWSAAPGAAVRRSTIRRIFHVNNRRIAPRSMIS